MASRALQHVLWLVEVAAPFPAAKFNNKIKTKRTKNERNCQFFHRGNKIRFWIYFVPLQIHVLFVNAVVKGKKF